MKNFKLEWACCSDGRNNKCIKYCESRLFGSTTSTSHDRINFIQCIIKWNVVFGTSTIVTEMFVVKKIVQ
jgi:hypothetical protein